MGQKTHPIGFRLGVIKTWSSRWYAGRDYGLYVLEDRKIRDYLKKRLEAASVSGIDIERFANKVKLTINTARPGIVIGRKGSEIEVLRKDLERLVEKISRPVRELPASQAAEGAPAPQPARAQKREIMIDIKEVRKPEICAQLVAENVAQQLQRRVAFRRAMKKCMSLALKFGAQGIKIHCAGRLGGAEMARREWYREGRVPLHTLRADVDYGFAEAKTTYGIIGVKVHIFKGEIMKDDRAE
ncbi:MAG: 30S ribosomal protein S3 [Deltaproteobacteria bacterium]|nr:30S ribosomal protein S3 [Deltaproteobacteria bacterium]